MLTLTDNASLIVKTIADQSESPATGLRITSEDAQEPAFAISTATGPEPEDQVLEQDGAQVYLDTSAASSSTTRCSTPRSTTRATSSSPSPSRAETPQHQQHPAASNGPPRSRGGPLR